MARVSGMEREIEALHGVRPARVEIFEDDAALYRARRRDRLQARPPWARRGSSFRAWWNDATPFQRFYRLWWWAFLALSGFGLGLLAFAVLGAVWVALT